MNLIEVVEGASVAEEVGCVLLPFSGESSGSELESRPMCVSDGLGPTLSY